MVIREFNPEDGSFGAVVSDYENGCLGLADAARGDGDGVSLAENCENVGVFYSRPIVHQLLQSSFLERIKKYPPLNLNLGISESMASEIDAQLSQQQQEEDQTYRNCSSSSYNHRESSESKASSDFATQEKLKAKSFPAKILKIGSWQWEAVHEGHLTAKCYYAKKKLVWEFLERALKRKIEIQWADIIGIRATTQENEPGILEVELRKPPTFHHEIDPQPRKHTNWRVTEDFTGGQAPTCRRHYLKFEPDVLNRPFEKLLQCDSRLLQLSQRPFPTLASAYFQYGIQEFSFDFGSQILPQIYNNGFQLLGSSLHPHLNIPSLFPVQQQLHPYHQPTLPLPMPMSMPMPMPIPLQMQPSTSGIQGPSSSQSAQDPGMSIWGQPVTSENYFPGNQVQGNFSIASPSTTQQVVSYYNDSINNYIETDTRLGGDDPFNRVTIGRDENGYLNNEYPNENYNAHEFAAARGALVSDATTNYEQNLSAFGDMELMVANELSSVNAEQDYMLPIACMLPLDGDGDHVPQAFAGSMDHQQPQQQQLPQPEPQQQLNVQNTGRFYHR